MARFFNTTGPSNPDRHYMLPASVRLIGATLDRYIKDELYWVLHAPRQSGKTTFLQSWMREINASGEAVSCYVSVERCQGFTDPTLSMPGICSAIREYASDFLPAEYQPLIPDSNDPISMLSLMLKNWSAQVAPKPLVVLFDEVDVLEDQSMVSFLRQIRGGFASRGIGRFPVSVALVGMRDLRDYIMKSKDGSAISPASPFNIKQNSASLANFSREDCHVLTGQLTAETGQLFESDAVDKIYSLTRGQPWLVNAIAQKCHWTLCPNGELITVEHILTAKEMLITEQAVHLDSLAEMLKDPQIKHVVQTILVGDIDDQLAEGDDFRLALDLGLVALDNGTPVIANPIYQEVFPRVLSYRYQIAVPAPEYKWQNDDGTLDLDALMAEFQDFWAQHADIWEARADYTEAFPHLLLMAFLQRVVNGGGQIEREYAAGRGRVDLAVKFGGKWSIIEIKLVSRQGRGKVLEKGLVQIDRYRDRIDPSAPAYLVIFDRTESGKLKSWEERLTRDVVATGNGREVVVIGG